MAINKILIVGGSSKLAKLFISAYANLYEIHATYSSASDNLAPGVFKSYSLDLNDTDSINNFIDTAKDLKFKAVIFFASTFAKDAEDNEERIRQFESDMRINVVSPIIIARSLNYINNDGRIFVFGDIYTSKPLPSMINYSYSKQLLELSTVNYGFPIPPLSCSTNASIIPLTSDFLITAMPCNSTASQQSLSCNGTILQGASNVSIDCAMMTNNDSNRVVCSGTTNVASGPVNLALNYTCYPTNSLSHTVIYTCSGNLAGFSSGGISLPLSVSCAG